MNKFDFGDFLMFLIIILIISLVFWIVASILTVPIILDKIYILLKETLK